MPVNARVSVTLSLNANLGKSHDPFIMSTAIDFRSDTVTRPSPGMRQAMADAPVGDDVFGDDPTVHRLQAKAAQLLGQEAGLFVTSGTQGNLLAILTHCQRGEEYIAGSKAHAYLEEAGGGAVLASVQPQPVENQADGTLDLASVRAAIKPDDFHFAITRLFCLENTFFGTPLPMDYLCDAKDLASEHQLRFHLDGARIFNAAVRCGIAPSTIGGMFDSVSACLSKGLGAPIGSVLTGSRDFIRRARRWRKMLGGGTRQVGILAAAGLYALEHNIERLEEDHEHAMLLADGLAEIEELEIQKTAQRTNMVFASMSEHRLEGLARFMQERGILITADENPVRLVTHLDIDQAGLNAAVDAFKDYFHKGA
ncbi:MAG: low-specificity L-threonine aldolase [Arenicellales bacterium]|nr:low-specificity L-threonine aldolase [Arenicellales bacterium]MDP6790955.1 low-specificity L-threonine aldolase [Arenicellales bacterium]MDP6918501.1 low-specificity L-threonine aldolase [Arenicellales bacterium]